jgi:tagatose 1,6-diphosphate aldolase GatY/KbaY
MISRSIQLGVSKFNVNTEVRQAYLKALQGELCGQSPSDLLEIAETAIGAMEAVITEKLELFGSVGKAHLHETPYALMLAGLSRS